MSSVSQKCSPFYTCVTPLPISGARSNTAAIFSSQYEKNTHKGIAPERYVEWMQCTLISASPTPCMGSESVLLHRCSGFWLQYCSNALFSFALSNSQTNRCRSVVISLGMSLFPLSLLFYLSLSPFPSLHASYAVCLHATFACKLRTDSLFRREGESAREGKGDKKYQLYTTNSTRLYISLHI